MYIDTDILNEYFILLLMTAAVWYGLGAMGYGVDYLDKKFPKAGIVTKVVLLLFIAFIAMWVYIIYNAFT
jgi:hypothetical protein